jgi:hypothetical protein
MPRVHKAVEADGRVERAVNELVVAIVLPSPSR